MQSNTYCKKDKVKIGMLLYQHYYFASHTFYPVIYKLYIKIFYENVDILFFCHNTQCYSYKFHRKT